MNRTARPQSLSHLTTEADFLCHTLAPRYAQKQHGRQIIDCRHRTVSQDKRVFFFSSITYLSQAFVTVKENVGIIQSSLAGS